MRVTKTTTDKAVKVDEKKEVVPMVWDKLPLPKLKYSKHPFAEHIKISEDVLVYDSKLGVNMANIHAIGLSDEPVVIISSHKNETLNNVTHYCVVTKP